MTHPENKTVPCDTDMCLADLTNAALSWGASRARVISPRKIQIKEALSTYCRSCPNFGQALSCPPNVEGPDAFRRWCKEYDFALFFKFLVPVEQLTASDRHQAFRPLHITAARLEEKAVGLGFAKARSFAGGSCRQVFCKEHGACSALVPADQCGPALSGRCRFPEHARPSMSGFGIDVAALIEAVQWDKEAFLEKRQLADETVAGVYGLVLIGALPGAAPTE